MREGRPGTNQSADETRLLSRLARDASGNTLALLAAGLLPLLGMIGGGVDMSRAYLAQSRLQQACDAGVLAARKSLGSQAAVDSAIPAQAANLGQRFFNLNFRDGIYGTEDREFQMYLEADYTLTGEAEVTVPTTVMNVFGFDQVNIDVECAAVLSFQNLDLMMVLDTTGSMRHTNAGDPMSRMDTMKQVIRDFHAELEANKAPGTRLRYGFVPYATNVNVGHLLRDEWVASAWTYQSREAGASTPTIYTHTYTTNWQHVSGTGPVEAVHSTYAATWNPGTPATPSGTGDEGGGGGSGGYYSCNGAVPAGAMNSNTETLSTTSEPYEGPPAGTKTTEKRRLTEDGYYYHQRRDGATCTIYRVTFNNKVQTYDHISHPAYGTPSTEWIYRPVELDVTNWRSQTPGCIEERATYAIDDYDNIDLTRALDLDLDLVPQADNPDTQWRPHYRDAIYVRSLDSGGSGSVTVEEVTSSQTFARTGQWWFSHCPAPAMALTEMDAGAVNAYLSTLSPEGATYHDIGMIWGGRLLSPDGLFAAENADVSANKPTNRHMVFLTDGQTEPYDIAYGAYGVDALDQRRWDPASPLSLTETVEQRFLAACKEVKKRNITVWVIAFGTDLNPTLTECAGDGHYFEAADAASLGQAFKTIAASLGDLRISR